MEAELASKPGDPYACAKLGGLEVDQGNTTRGIALLEMGLEHCQSEQHRERYELLLHLGIANSSNKPEEAERYYRLALEEPLSPQVLVGARLNLGALLLRLNKLAEATEVTAAVTRQAARGDVGLVQPRPDSTQSRRHRRRH